MLEDAGVMVYIQLRCKNAIQKNDFKRNDKEM